MTLDRKLSLLAQAVQIIAFVGVVIGIWTLQERRLTASENKIVSVEEAYKKHEDIESKRLERIENKIDRLLEKRER